MKKITNLILIITIIGIAIAPIISNAKTSDKPKENFANVIFFAYFKGDTEGREKLIKNANNIIKMYEGTGELTVKGYLNKVSYNKFNLKNIFPQYDGNKIIPFELPCSSEGLEKNNLDYTIIHSLISSIPNIKDNLDYNNDGYIDNLSVILEGGSDNAESNSTLVSHKSDYGSNETWSGKKIGTYNMLNTYSINNNGAGVITHEFLHSLGYPDLYTSQASSYPVYTWDIMGSVSKYMSYPLAYLRMKYTNWLNIDTITKSQTLTLDSQDKAEGNQAYILKSPLNEYELFVVEFRKKSKDMEHLDRTIGESGVIVYRVNTTVTGLSNNRGQTGIYVFREESGKTDDNTLRNEIYNAAYPKKNGKKSIGSSDLNVTKGALTFSDGTNSGIVIKNIKSNGKDSMKLDVIIPDAKDYDTWKNTNYADELNKDEYILKDANIISYKNKAYTVNVGNGKIYTNIYDGTQWKNINTSNMEKNTLGNSLLNLNEELYLLNSSNENINLYKYNNGWTKITSINDTNGTFSYKVHNGKLYVAKTDTKSVKATLYEYKNNKFEEIGTYYKGNSKKLVGIPKIEVINDKIYAICREGTGNIKIYKLENGIFKEIPNDINSNQFDVVSHNNKLYFALGSARIDEKMKMVIYDGKNFETINTDLIFGDPKMTVSQGNLYMLVTDITGSGKAKIYAYNENSKKFEQEGIDVDNAANPGSLSLISIDNKIYVLLKRTTDQSIVVKEKETVNSLQSISIIPPKKTTYIVGEKLDVTGLKVTANYVKEHKEVDNYKIDGFSTLKSGEYLATIMYEGKSNTFAYTVVEEIKNYKTLTEYLNQAGYKTSGKFVSGFTLGEKIENIKLKLENKEVNISNNDIIATGMKFSYNGEQYKAVVYGDINGDGIINSADLLCMRQHLIKMKTLEDEYKQAAMLVNNDTINSADLLKLRQHLLKINSIEQ